MVGIAADKPGTVFLRTAAASVAIPETRSFSRTRPVSQPVGFDAADPNTVFQGFACVRTLGQNVCFQNRQLASAITAFGSLADRQVMRRKPPYDCAARNGRFVPRLVITRNARQTGFCVI